jgi:uncharacterized RDD family membrane protein YckC
VNARPPGQARPAGFWIRAVAGLADFVVLLLVQSSLVFAGKRLAGAAPGGSPALQASVVLCTLLFAALSTTVLHAWGGQTLGKLIAGVRVVAVDGAPLPAGAALLRWFGYFGSLAPLGLGFAMAGLRRDKRALHDLLAGSRVERCVPRRRERPAGAPAPPAAPPLDTAEPV